jgi:cell division protein FtsB
MLDDIMKILIFTLLGLFLILQFKLWFSDEGLFRMFQLRHEVAIQAEKNQELQKSNNALRADIDALKKGDNSIEEHARNDLGMIKKGEVFYQIVK